ncbi:Unknown protein [Striga hermonthica]|uniref:Uncharacterized protein n=1 Tax=Striga hermonthica TaxID=68872 RepID=A0A9N7MM87_STRHE|nr:Unknown protein [Striga hermonthica]
MPSNSFKDWVKTLSVFLHFVLSFVLVPLKEGFIFGLIAAFVSDFREFISDIGALSCTCCMDGLYPSQDGTWGTIKGSCTVVRDFADLCYNSYQLYLKELRENTTSNELQPLRFIHVPACIIVGLFGLIVEIPLYTAIAIVKSPYMFKGRHRLLHDLISREGPFLETACILIAADLCDWLKAKHSSGPHVIDVGLSCYSFLHVLLDSIKLGSTGLVLLNGTEVNHLNRPQDKLMDWFFNPVLILKEQVRALRLEEG